MQNRWLLCSITYLLLLLSTSLWGQEKRVFGKVSKEELEMNSYALDTTAGAVILFDVGEFGGNDLKFMRHIRIKILKKSGLDWGNWVFNTPSKGDFKVFVFNLENGEIIKEKANSKTIYSETIVDRFEIYKVFAPNVKVGSVIDLSYSHLGLPFEWRFQERIPVKYSNLKIFEARDVTFSKSFFGFEKISPVSDNEWEAHNMPAFNSEPYLNHFSNYLTKFQFQLESVNIPGYRSFYFSSSWSVVINNLLELDDFGGVLNQGSFLNDYAKEIKRSDNTTTQKIKEAFRIIQENIAWDGTKSAFGNISIRKNFLTSHSGNSAEINLLLICLLNKIGINTYPVVLSTRENGMLQQHVPAVDRINYVVGYVQHEGVEMLLDATDTNLSPGILPRYCLNGMGLLVKKGSENWIDLNNNNIESTRQFVNIKLYPDGTSSCKVTLDYFQYGFLKWVQELKDVNSDEEILLNKYRKKFPKTDLHSYSIKKKDLENLTGSEILELDISNNLIDTGDEYILNPFVLFEFLENPFKSSMRKYPVDLACPKKIDLTVVIQLPSGVGVKGMPESQKLITPDGGASFTYLSNSSYSTIQLKVQLNLYRAIYTETEYLELRQFFSELLKILNTPLQLAKT